MQLPKKEWAKDVVRHSNEFPSRQGKIRLDMSERAQSFPHHFWENFLGSLTQEDFMCYPEITPLIDKVADFHSINRDYFLFAPGIDAIIKTVFDAFIEKGDKVLFSNPCFPMYGVYAGLAGAQVSEIDYKKDLSLDITSLIATLEQSNIKVLFLANPNSPIGDFLEEEKIITILELAEKKETIVFLDEAYVEFAPYSSIKLIEEYKNLIVARTFSKALGIAGLRGGYLAADIELADYLARWRQMFQLNQVAVKMGLYLFDNYDIVDKYVKEVISTRNSLEVKMIAKSFDFISSHTNFIHFHRGRNQSKVIEILKKHNVLFRTVSIPHDERKDWLRISVIPELDEQSYMNEIYNVD